MNVFNQIRLLVRGRTRAAAQRVVDVHGLEIAAEAITEAEAVLTRSKHELSHLVVERKRVGRSVERLEGELAQRDRDGRDALAAGDAELAGRLARDVARKERERDRAGAALERLEARETTVRESIREMADSLHEYRQEFQLLRAGSRTAAVTLTGGNTTGPRESLAELRGIITRFQGLQDDRFEHDEAYNEVERELSGASLDSELEARGLGGRQPEVEVIMARWEQGAAPPPG